MNEKKNGGRDFFCKEKRNKRGGKSKNAEKR